MAKELFSQPIDYTAIFASTDSNALGILEGRGRAILPFPTG